MDKEEKYRCSYERDMNGVIYVTRNGSTESIFVVTPVFHSLKLSRTWAKESELSTQKEVAKNYLKELIKNRLL